jgi:hypothetical protein
MDDTVSVIVDHFREVHQRMRAQLDGLDLTLVHRAPAPEANSIAVLISHTLGSEMEVIRQVAGVPAPRDRTVEFAVTPATLDLDGLRAALDAADRLLDELGPRITPDRLAALVERGERGWRTGRAWLIRNYGHACEHLGHIELTRQLLTQPL